jgi:hypothetical protein
MELSKKDLRKCTVKAAEGANFMQKFKMEVWRKYPNIRIGEDVLDELAMIAFNLLKK